MSAENSLYEIKLVWQELVKHSHPDQIMASGIPFEAVKLAEKPLVRINKAYNPILAQNSLNSDVWFLACRW